GDVGTRFVDDSDYAKWYAHLRHAHAIGTRGGRPKTADRIRHGGNLTQAFHHAVQGFVAERESIQHRGGQTVAAARFQVARVFLFEVVGALFNQASHGAQGRG